MLENLDVDRYPSFMLTYLIIYHANIFGLEHELLIPSNNNSFRKKISISIAKMALLKFHYFLEHFEALQPISLTPLIVLDKCFESSLGGL